MYALIILADLLFGIWRGTQRQIGLTIVPYSTRPLPPLEFLVWSGVFLGFALVAWVPIGWNVSPSAHVWMLVIGALLYLAGLTLVLWSRLALGKNFNFSFNLSVQLFVDHQLVTGGPYTIIRHPMYMGAVLAAWGSLLIYFKQTTLMFAVLAPALLLLCRREEDALLEVFGERWQKYRKRVPASIPRLFRSERDYRA